MGSSRGPPLPPWQHPCRHGSPARSGSSDRQWHRHRPILHPAGRATHSPARWAGPPWRGPGAGSPAPGLCDRCAGRWWHRCCPIRSPGCPRPQPSGSAGARTVWSQARSRPGVPAASPERRRPCPCIRSSSGHPDPWFALARRLKPTKPTCSDRNLGRRRILVQPAAEERVAHTQQCGADEQPDETIGEQAADDADEDQ